MQAILPEIAVVKTWDRGEQPVGTVKSGDRIIGYSRRDKDVRVLTVTVEPAPPEPVLVLDIDRWRSINLFAGTMCQQAMGAVRADDPGRYFMGTCFMNPTLMIPRIVQGRGEAEAVAGVVLHWEGADLLWSEGLLVGS